MLLRDVISELERIAPSSLALSWDNVGLLVGDPDEPVSKALLTIDLTRAVMDECIASGAELVVSYHPPIFQPLKRVVAGSLVFEALSRGVAIHSPHTALDVAEGGTNDMLADALGLEDRWPLRRAESKDVECKLVVFVPAEHAERVSSAMFAAGAGRIGDYASCSFRSAGMGTFFGEAGANPRVGERGKLEEVSELRIETRVPLAKAPQVIAAMKAAHPYEEAAFDLLRLAPPPNLRGMGRIGTRAPIARGALLEAIKRALGVSHLLVAGPIDGDVTRAAACAGAAGDHAEDARAQGAELYLTGEMRHHDALRAAAAGMTVVCALHSGSERAVLTRVASRLGEVCPGVSFAVSGEDRDPFRIV